MTNPTVLIVEDDANLREALFDTLSSDELDVMTADNGESALEILKTSDVGLVVSDVQMKPMDGIRLLEEIRSTYPSLPAVLMTAYGTIESAVDVMRNGAADYLVKPFEADELKSMVGRYLKASASDDSPIAEDPASVRLFALAERVASTDATVTISGESGCGKEVVARFIHDRSPRANENFVAINCAAIPENMLEAVLFGYEKGAFTGAAAAHPGKFEQANNGTLLLDEISEMDMALQAKLLRVIQEKEVERLGGRKLIPLNVRVIATTNRDLRRHVSEGRFREDLFYRLNVFPVQIPPLRERTDDILPLSEMFLSRYSQDPATSISFDESARRALLAHPWPGNVRELENLVQRTLILLSRSTIGVDDLAFESAPASEAPTPADDDLQAGLRHREFQLIIDAMTAQQGKRGAVARALGISPRTLRYKLARMREAGIAIPGEGAAITGVPQ
ncbi:MAG: sigma-54 dependent transcriptional regulator [Woeseiaceae bacterium]|nr:sigma-54 dependent transcriptional regulator [Woeseiaceae bacterium]